MADYVGKKLKVYWVDDDDWYEGEIDNYDKERGYHIKYYDGEEEWLPNLDKNVIFEDPIQQPGVNSLDETNTTDFNELEIIPDDHAIDENSFSNGVAKMEPKFESGDDNESTKEYSRRNNDVTPSEISNLDGIYGSSNNKSSDKSLQIDKYIRKQKGINEKEKVLAYDDYLSFNDRIDDYRKIDRGDDAPRGYDMIRNDNIKGNSSRTSYHRRDYKEKTLDVVDNNFGLSNEEGIHDEEREIKVEFPNRGLLLVGTVTGASNLPPMDEDETNGMCFFRVLYVEGMGQSTMFNCKTPIFTSEVTEDRLFPQWRQNSGTFRFEMIMPDQKDNSQLRLQGKILVVFYREKAQGGHQFLGQSSFDLGHLSKTGIKKPHQSDLETRSESGLYPLTDRYDKVIGNYADVQVSLQISWRPNSFHSGEQLMIKTLESARGSRVRAPDASDGSVTGTVRTKQSVGLKSRPGTVPSRAYSSIPFKAAPVKVVSRQMRKQAEDKRRIDIENKALNKKLQSYGTKGRGEVVGAIYDQVAEPKKQPSSSTRVTGAKERDDRDTKDFKNTKPSLEKLSEFFRRLNKDVSEIEDENLLLMATLSKLKTHSKKYELATDRLKKETRSNVNSNVSKQDVAIRTESLAKEIEEEGIEGIADSELKEIVIENIMLQQLRRSLVTRAKIAKTAYQNFHTAVSDAKDSETVLRDRVRLIAPNACAAQASTTISPEMRGEINDLKELIERQSNVQLDFLCAEAARDHDIHIGPLVDAIQEDTEVIKSLRNTLEKLKQETDQYRHHRDIGKQKLRELTEERTVFKLKDSVIELRSLLLKMRRNQRLQVLEDGSQYFEREITNLNSGI